MLTTDLLITQVLVNGSLEALANLLACYRGQIGRREDAIDDPSVLGLLIGGH